MLSAVAGQNLFGTHEESNQVNEVRMLLAMLRYLHFQMLHLV